MPAESAYALVQVAHNFGAVAVVGGPVSAWLCGRERNPIPQVFAWITLSGWFVQAFSGIGFGLTSYLSSGELPEIAGAALFALYLKVSCAFAGVALAGYYLVAAQRRERIQHWVWPCLIVAGAAALSGAAVLRWFG